MAITLDPFQRITNVFWPEGGGGSSSRTYITTDCYVRMFLGDAGGESGIWPTLPNPYPPAPEASRGTYTTFSRYEEFPSSILGYPVYFNYLELFDRTGALITGGEAGALDATVTRPTLPHQETYMPWTRLIENPIPFWSSPGPELVDIPFSGYAAGGASAAFAAVSLNGAPQRYAGTNPLRPREWAEAALITGSETVNSIDLSAVTVMWQARTFSLLGTRTTYLSSYGGYLAIRVLLVNEGSA